MTYEQIEKMSKDDLVYAFKRLTEITEDASSQFKAMEAKYSDIFESEDYCAHSHIGFCEASFSILLGRLESVVDVLTKK